MNKNFSQDKYNQYQISFHRDGLEATIESTTGKQQQQQHQQQQHKITEQLSKVKHLRVELGAARLRSVPHAFASSTGQQQRAAAIAVAQHQEHKQRSSRQLGVVLQRIVCHQSSLYITQQRSVLLQIFFFCEKNTFLHVYNDFLWQLIIFSKKNSKTVESSVTEKKVSVYTTNSGIAACRLASQEKKFVMFSFLQ